MKHMFVDVAQLLDVWGADSVQSQLDGISRNKTVYKQVTSMLAEFKLVVRTRWKWVDPVLYKWFDV